MGYVPPASVTANRARQLLGLDDTAPLAPVPRNRPRQLLGLDPIDGGTVAAQPQSEGAHSLLGMFGFDTSDPSNAMALQFLENAMPSTQAPHTFEGVMAAGSNAQQLKLRQQAANDDEADRQKKLADEKAIGGMLASTLGPQYAPLASNPELAGKLFDVANPTPKDDRTELEKNYVSYYNETLQAGGKPMGRLEYQQALKSSGGGDVHWANTTVPLKGPDGKFYVGQINDAGGQRVIPWDDGYSPVEPTTTVNTGTAQTVVGRGGDVKGAIPIDNAGAERDKAVGKGTGEIEVAKPAMKVKATGALSGLQRQTSLVGQDIDRVVTAIDGNPTFTTGTLGDWSKALPGSPAYDVAQTLLTIKSNVGFDKLQEMRDNSPTGGALGQVSDTENALLQAVDGAMAQGQTKDQLKFNLKRVKDLQAQVLAEKQAAFGQTFGADDPQSTGGGNPGSSPASGTTLPDPFGMRQ